MGAITSPSGQRFVVPDSVEADYLEQGFTGPGQERPELKPRPRRGRSTPRASEPVDAELDPPPAA